MLPQAATKAACPFGEGGSAQSALTEGVRTDTGKTLPAKGNIQQPLFPATEKAVAFCRSSLGFPEGGEAVTRQPTPWLSRNIKCA